MEQSNNKTKIRAHARVDARGESGAGQPVPQGPGAGKRPAMPGRGLEAVIWLLAFAPLVLCAVLWRSLPQQLPMQFSLDGEVNRLGSKPEFLLLCAAGPALTALLAFLPRIDPHRENYRKFARGYRVLRLAFALFYLLAACSVPVAALFPGVFRQVPVSRLMLAGTGPFVLCDRQLYAQIPAQLFLRHQKPLGPGGRRELAAHPPLCRAAVVLGRAGRRRAELCSAAGSHVCRQLCGFSGIGGGAVCVFVHFVQKSARKHARFLVAFGPPVRYTRVS